MEDIAGLDIMSLGITISLIDRHVISFRAWVWERDPIDWIVTSLPKVTRARRGNIIHIEASFAVLTPFGTRRQQHTHHIEFRFSRGKLISARAWVRGANYFLVEKFARYQ